MARQMTHKLTFMESSWTAFTLHRNIRNRLPGIPGLQSVKVSDTPLLHASLHIDLHVVVDYV